MKLNIRAKLIGGFLIVVAMLLVVFGVGWNGLASMGAATDRIVRSELPKEEAAGELMQSLAARQEAYLDFLLSSNDESRVHVVERAADVEVATESLRELVSEQPELVSTIGEFAEEYDVYLESSS